jgi:AbrB family looped-hinge helix DNA binding protein
MYQERVVAVTKVFNRGQTYIPADIRKRLGLKDGDKVVWIEENGRFFLKKA